MKRMAMVHRKAEEWRAQARHQHSDQIQKTTEQAKKIINHHRQDSHFSGYASCGCFPCSSHRWSQENIFPLPFRSWGASGSVLAWVSIAISLFPHSSIIFVFSKGWLKRAADNAEWPARQSTPRTRKRGFFHRIGAAHVQAHGAFKLRQLNWFKRLLTDELPRRGSGTVPSLVMLKLALYAEEKFACASMFQCQILSIICRKSVIWNSGILMKNVPKMYFTILLMWANSKPFEA